MHIEPYLDRIQVKKKNHPDLRFLAELQREHLMNIYFENLDILAGKPISLDSEQLFEKIITNQRGGVCFELNGLFHQLLKQLGYQVSLIAGTTHEENRWFPLEDTHLANLVHIEKQTFLVDVGLGGNAPRKPVPLSGEEIEDVDGIYRIVEMQSDGYILEKKIEGNWKKFYRFTPEEKRIEYFEEKCRLIERSPDSPFNKDYFLTKTTATGRVTLSGNSLTVVEGDQKQKLKFQRSEIPMLIKKHFHITI